MISIDEKQTELMFGTGDIGFNAGAIQEGEERVGIVIFYNQEPREIGALGDIKAGTEVRIKDFPVVMLFKKKESVDELIKALEEVKIKMK